MWEVKKHSFWEINPIIYINRLFFSFDVEMFEKIIEEDMINLHCNPSKNT